MHFKILFNTDGPIPSQKISQSLEAFPNGYARTVRQIIQATESSSISESLFFDITVKVLNSFKMTRPGPFKGLGYNPDCSFKGPIEKLSASRDSVQADLFEIKSLLNSWGLVPRGRKIIQINDYQLQEVTRLLWISFKKLLLITMSTHSYGLVGASKILFGIFPEIVLPVDNEEWKQLFKTVDLSDVIKLMRNEIIEWEKQSGQMLDGCEPANVPSTLPAIYNVMAMKAR
jgi:hypothetical protein